MARAEDRGAKRFRGLLFPVIAVLASLLLGGCSAMQAAKARLEPRDQFVQSPLHAQLRFLPGTEDMALRMARALDASIESVEAAHGRKFPEPPKVYVCDAPCFARFSTMHASVPAGHFMDSVFMNEPELRGKERQFGMAPENFLVHELTHLMFYQYAGALAYMRTPAWFREGWAVLVSEGAGAQACTPAEAARHLLEGASFDPAEEGSLFWNRTAASYGLRYPVFYRQASMFVAYLRATDASAFQAALDSLLNGERFQHSFERAYGKPISAYWMPFMQNMRERFAPILQQDRPARRLNSDRNEESPAD